MRQLEEQERHAGAELDGDDSAASILGALPSEPIDPVLARHVACAAGWAYHFIAVAQHLYASH